MIGNAKKEDQRLYTLREERPHKAVLKLGLPLVAGMFIMVLYNLVDTFFIGLMRDDYQLAAVNLAYPVMMISVAVSNMVGTGAASLMARSIGAGDLKKARHTLTSGIELTILNSTFITGIGFLFLRQIISGLGARSNTFLYTQQYVSILLLGTIFTMGNYTLGQLLRSEGSVRYSILGMVGGTITNIILDPIFIFALNMKIRGAAIATILGNGFGMMISLYFYFSKKTILQPDSSCLFPKKEILKEIFWVGVPATLETLLTSVAYIVNNNLAVAYGELTVAAMGITQKILSIGSYVYQGMAAGCQPLMGYNYGAKNYRRMLDILKSGVFVISAIELGIMTVFFVTAPWIMQIFTDSAKVIHIGCIVLRVLMLILPFVGSVSMSRITFQSMGKPQYAFAITLVRQFVLYVPLLLGLNYIFGFYGMIFAQPITEIIMMTVSLIFLRQILHKLDTSSITS